jgi:acyl transferase domain-containing protein
MTEPVDDSAVAIVGMAGRFPGAPSVEDFWSLLLAGTEAITFFTERELAEEGIPAEVLADRRYVRAKGALADPDLFDAEFFGFSPSDAACLDPQQRLFLECAWQAIEGSGIDPERTTARIGVYAGSSTGTYLTRSLRELAYRPDFMELVLGNDKDMLTTRTSYKLGLTGPSVCVQSACSTSLVAVHMACQGLLSGDCDVALAGATSVMFPRREGYLFTADGIYSHDGHCRPFDARATGTLPGDGVGIVVLKLLTDAIADGDTIHAVVRGTAVNNDGATKVGFTAPSVSGQAQVIRAAQLAAGVDADTIGYVEAHGTATSLGDPVEIAGLTRAFRAGTDRQGYCAIGSVKANIGHLDVAAGVAGLIKTVLALEHGTVPPTPHFERANPAMNISTSPFFVADRPLPWPGGDGPRRAGVSSFGIGGTNAHVVLEQAPDRPTAAPAPGPHLLPLSGRTAEAVDRIAAGLARHLAGTPGLALADVAGTLQTGRRMFAHRRFVVAQDTADAVRALADRPGGPTRWPDEPPAVTFLLPGQGAQHVRMGAGLHAAEPVFRAEVDRGLDRLSTVHGLDLRPLLFPADPDAADARALDRTDLAQPALFLVEYALARLWESWGIRPAALLGHSVGEYVAACLAGVFAFDDALDLVVHRGRLMQRTGPGAMLGVRLPEHELADLPGGLAVAAVNAADLCTVAGATGAIADLERELAGRGVETSRLHTIRAFHTGAMVAAAQELRAVVARIPARPPELPYVSNVTGDWITAEQAVDPDYWVEHTVRPVRFAAGLDTAVAVAPLLLEVGPGQTLTTLARRRREPVTVVPSLGRPRSAQPDTAVLREALGTLWTLGAPVDWHRFQAHRRHRTVPLPTYPFERRRHWLHQPGDLPAPSGPPAGGPPASEPAPAAPRRPEPFTGPQADLQAELAAIWTELLGVGPLGPEDDFFRLGGHSLLGTRLTTRLRDRLGVEVRLGELFETPTIAGQADLIATLLRFGGARPRPVGDGPGRSAAYEEGQL